MSRRPVLATAATLLLSMGTGIGQDAHGAPASGRGGMSVGLILGDPTGLTLRNELGGADAIQAHFGFSSYPGGAVAAMVDWTRDVYDFVNGQTASLLMYLGIGAKAQWFTGRDYGYKHHDHDRFHDDSQFGLGGRGLVGLRMPFRNAPFDIFLELAPIGVLLVVPDGGAYYDVDLAVGFRYRF